MEKSWSGNSLVVVGDVHFKNIEPYKSSLFKLFEYLEATFPENDFLFLGDIYDSSSPHWSLVLFFNSWIKNHGGRVFVIHGNHEYSQIKGSALLSLVGLKNKLNQPVELFDKPEIFRWNTLRFAACPYFDDYTVMKKVYSEISDEVDYTFCHLTPKKHSFGDEFIHPNVTARKAHIYGHIHLQDDYFDPETDNRIVLVGVPQVTRNGEEVCCPMRVGVIDSQTGELSFHHLPEYLTFETITFGEEPKKLNSILNVVDAPSIPAVYERYKNHYVRRSGISLKLSIDSGKTEARDPENDIPLLTNSLMTNLGLYKDHVGMDASIYENIQKVFQLKGIS